MQLILTAVQAPLAQAWSALCGDLPFVTVHHGSILDVPCDAMVSPANSFGFMDGGIDRLYRDYFGRPIEARVQQMIADRHFGELLVGAADLVATDHPATPYLFVAPTMRMPMTIATTVNAYLAARAVLLLWKHGRIPAGPDAGQPVRQRISSVAFPGLGTGVGRMDPLVAARQVRAAIDDVLRDRFTPPASWGHVLQRHEELLGAPLPDL